MKKDKISYLSLLWRLSIWVTIFFFTASTAFAANGTMTQVHDLNFGAFGLHDNKSLHTLIISPSNVVTADPAYIVGVPPQRGEYQITGLPANDTLNISINTSNSITAVGPGIPAFTVNNYKTNSPLQTDPSGRATLYVGASLQTSGAGTYYSTNDYNGNFDLTIIY